MRALPALLALAMLLAGTHARPLGPQTGRGLSQADSLTPVHQIIDKVCRHIAATHGTRCADWDADRNFPYTKQYFGSLPTLSATPTYGQFQVIKPAIPPENVIGDTAVCSNGANFTVNCNKQISFSATDTVSWSTTSSLKVGTKSSLSIPGIGSEELSFEYSFALTAGESNGKTRSFTDSCSAAVPPGGCVKCTMLVEVSKAHIKIPMTLSLTGGVAFHHDPAVANVAYDGDGKTHYYRWWPIGTVVGYALQYGLIDEVAQGPVAAWTHDANNAAWSTIIDVKGADIGSSTTLATACDVDPLHPVAAAASTSRRSSASALPPPKELTPVDSGAPPAITAEPAMSRPVFMQTVQAANAEMMQAAAGTPLAV